MPYKEESRVAAIIPAFNEEKTVAQVIEAVKSCSLISEIIVVNDGSDDKTGAIAQAMGVRVIRQPKNLGKGQAMQTGSTETTASILIFIDADLIGLKAYHLDRMINAIKEGNADMSIGAIDRRRRLGFIFMHFFNHTYSPLAGTRAIKRDFWEKVPSEYKKKFQVESAISYLAKKQFWRVKIILLDQVTHLVKEKKQGLALGFIRRIKMFSQILWINIFIRFFDV